VHVTVKLYATLRQYGKSKQAGAPFEIDLSEDATVQDLINQLKIRPEETRITFVNGIIQEHDWKLKDGDVVGMFPPIGGGSMAEILVDVWLYGDLARYGGRKDKGSFANPKVKLPEGSTLGDLLKHLHMPTEDRGITFINGELSAMPNMQPDLDHLLKDNDRVAFFHLRSMWPFQYRFGIKMAGEMSESMQSSKDQGLHHAYKQG